ERIYKEVFKDKHFDINAEDLELWKVQISNKRREFLRLNLNNMEGVKKLEGTINDFWEEQPPKEFTHIIVDLTTLKKLKQVEQGKGVNTFIVHAILLSHSYILTQVIFR